MWNVKCKFPSKVLFQCQLNLKQTAKVGRPLEITVFMVTGWFNYFKIICNNISIIYIFKNT